MTTDLLVLANCNSMQSYVILLTACVNPGGMPFTVLNDTSERLNQYREALDFYLSETILPIVFCENTMCDISNEYSEFIESGRMEYIAFNGNDFDKSKGKGFGEAIILQTAISRSSLIDEKTMIIKVTGRLKVFNINSLITDNEQIGNEVIQTLFSSSNMIDSRLIIAPCLFFTEMFLPQSIKISDSDGVFFEHKLYDAIVERKRYSYYPFLIVPQIIGISGSTGNRYVECVCARSVSMFRYDMLGNAMRFDKKCSCSHFRFWDKIIIILKRCSILITKASHLYKFPKLIIYK